MSEPGRSEKGSTLDSAGKQRPSSWVNVAVESPRFTEGCTRLAFVAAVIPTALACSYVSGVISDSLRFDPNRCATSTGVAIATFAILLIWRAVIRWSFVRGAATVGLTIASVGQVLFWQPLWSTGCVLRDDMLREAQAATSLGLWCIGCVLTWWGGLLLRRASRGHVLRRQSMRPDVARVALTLSLVPLLPGVFWVYLAAETEWWSGATTDWTGIRAYELCLLICVAMCVLTWKNVAFRTRRRAWLTVLGTSVLLVSPATVLLPQAWVVGPGESLWVCIRWSTPIFAASGWIAAMARLWCAKPGELRHELRRIAPDLMEVTCPKCRYSLIGLRETRCPECGWQTTVDAIVHDALASAMELDT